MPWKVAILLSAIYNGKIPFVKLFHLSPFLCSAHQPAHHKGTDTQASLER